MKNELLDEINKALKKASYLVDDRLKSMDGRPGTDGTYSTLTPKLQPSKPETYFVGMIEGYKREAYQKIEDIVKDPSFTDENRKVILDKLQPVLTQTGHESIYNQVNQFIQEQPYRSIIFKDFNAAATEKMFDGKHAEQAAEIKKQPDRTDGLTEIFERNAQHQRSNSHDRDKSQERDER